MLTVSALWDSSGTINGWLGIARDISESKKAESALRESELQLSNALQLAKAGQWSYDVEADRFTFTDNFYRIFRTTAEKVGGYHLSSLEYATKFVHPDELQIVGSEIRNAIETTDPLYFKELEHRFLFADGEVGHLAVRFTLKKDDTGKTVQLYGVNQDITKRKLAEAHLHSTLERLRMASEAAQVAIWTWNFDDDSLEWDARMYAIYGLDPSNFSNGIVYQDWYESIHPDDKSKAFDDLIDSLSADGPYFREFRIVRPDGTVRYIQAASVVHSDSDGKPLQMIGINRDITEQRDLERYLTTTKQDAEAANLAKSQFLAHMSHEVRTPLTAVLGYADMLSDRSLSASDSVDAVNSIRRNGSHLLTILDDILDLSKIEAGKMVIEAIPASPWQIAFEAVTLLKIRAADKQVELLVTPDSHLPESCLIDPTRMRQVLVNLLSNAVKFTEPGGKIELSVRSDGDSIVYESRDTGIGLSEEQLTRIFEPFLQADTSTTRKFGGTGLGLTITRKLVEAMHGTITARSEVRKGSCFTVRLPITTSGKGSIRWIMPKELLKSTTLEHQFEQPKIQQPFHGKILLADDSADNRRVIQYMLKRHGLLADVAVNGAQAVTTASQNTYDLILMDMQMPEMDGFTATRLIRESGYDKSIIALTASTMSHDRNKAIEAGCTDFLSKPIEPHAFVEMLSKYLGSVSVR
jgi:PAS domain S-box-containing protein